MCLLLHQLQYTTWVRRYDWSLLGHMLTYWQSGRSLIGHPTRTTDSGKEQTRNGPFHRRLERGGSVAGHLARLSRAFMIWPWATCPILPVIPCTGATGILSEPGSRRSLLPPLHARPYVLPPLMASLPPPAQQTVTFKSQMLPPLNFQSCPLLFHSHNRP